MRLIDFVNFFPDKPWSWHALSCNPSITFEDVKAHSDKPWSWRELSANPSITFYDVKSHPDKPWNWQYLSSNTFKGQHALNCQRIWRYYSEQKRVKAARKISSWAFEIYFDPSKGFIENSYMSKHFKELQNPHI